MTSPPITAALTLSLTGRYERQGTEAAEGVRLWAEASDVRLILVDDQGSKEVALRAYRGWVETADLLIGPYGSGLVRAIAPLVRDTGRVLWNHGGSADDLAQPGIASLPATASSYFDGVVDEAVDRKVSRTSPRRALLIVVQAPGPFARAVADSAKAQASERGIESHVVEALGGRGSTGCRPVRARHCGGAWPARTRSISRATGRRGCWNLGVREGARGGG